MNVEANLAIGDFRIERRLGAGGMGIVYLARQVSLNRLVALKILGPALTDRGQVERFQREARAVARLNHPGIAGVYFIGKDGQLWYIAMEYVDGLSLREIIRHLAAARNSGESIDSILQANRDADQGLGDTLLNSSNATEPPSPEPSGTTQTQDTSTPQMQEILASAQYIRRCCEIVCDVASALAYANENGVVHRDIKPENIMLDRQGKIHLIDFGLARLYEDVTLTNTGALVGTPAYMSPEQVSGHLQVDHRTDVYSLGLVLYELLSLRRPITAPTREGVLRKIVTKALPPLTRHNPTVSRRLEAVVHKATAKDPDERYATAGLFASDLRRVLEDKPVEARPYRFTFDETEIIATRPKYISFCSFLFFLIAGICLFIAGGAFIAGPRMTGNPYFLLILFGLFFGYLNYWVGYGLARGKREARTTAHILFTIFTGVGLAKLLLFELPIYLATHENLTRIESRSSVVSFCLWLLFWLTVQLFLLKSDTRAWFRLAASLRSDHNKN